MCRLTASVCSNGQIWNKDKCRCECREYLVGNEIFGTLVLVCVCYKSCGKRDYLDYKNCVCRNSIVDKLLEDCTKVVDGNKIFNETLNTISSNDCASCALYVVLFAVFLTASVIIGSAFICFYYYSKRKSDNQSHLKNILLLLNNQLLKH